jgi:hypothetical protein
MESDDNEAGAGLDQQSFNATQSQSARKPRGIAPVWHTVILILAIIAVSFLGVHRHPGGAGIGATNRLRTYGVTACLELVLMGWVLFGIRLRGVSLRSIIGKASSDLRSIALDVGIAALFWIGSLMALATVALMWFSIQTAITHKPIPIQSAHGSQPTIPKPADDESAPWCNWRPPTAKKLRAGCCCARWWGSRRSLSFAAISNRSSVRGLAARHRRAWCFPH